MTTITAPTHLSVPEHDASSGDEYADLAEMAGMTPDPAERIVLNALLAERSGRWAAFEAAIVCGRQNLKTHTLEITALGDVFLRDVSRVVWTAHRYKTAADSFADLAAVVENNDWLRKRTHRVTTAAGDQSIKLLPRHSGPRIDFLARSTGGGRGLDGDTVILDEALYLTPAMMGALLPVLSSKPDPQVRYGSSAGLLESEVLRAIRNRGRAGGDPTLAYVEWATDRDGSCVDRGCGHELDAVDCSLDDEGRWFAANPALGGRISLDYVRSERRALPATEFARERLGWWEDPPNEGALNPIPYADWVACSSQVDVSGSLVFAVDVSPDRTWSAVVAAGTTPDDGLVAVEVVDTRRGTTWVVDRVVELWERWSPESIVVDPSGPAGSLVADLEQAGVQLVQMTARDMAQACGELYDAVVSGSMRHRGQPELDTAMRLAVAKPRGDGGWAWSRSSSTGDISPLVAATAAFWGRSRGGEPGVFVL